MNRNSPKKGYAGKKRLKAWQVGLCISSVAVLICAVACYAWLRYHPQNQMQVTASFSRMKTWVSERKTHLNQGLVKVKRLAANKDVPPEIHFEFYTALPGMQVKVVDLNAQERNAQSGRTRKDIVPGAAVVSEKTQSTASKLSSTAIFSEHDLERDLSAQVIQKSYVIQLGIFNSKTAAGRYSATLVSAGFQASVVKATVAGNNIYRVQLGPFKSQDQARIAQKELQKKGLNGIMRKIELG
jgi:hypothetical protein